MNDIWQDYFIDGTDVLKNKLGITDKDTLKKEERLITLQKLTELEMFPEQGEFNPEHLKAIHKFLFGDIYYFAGEYRKCEMARFRDFALPLEIEKRLEEELNLMNENVKHIRSIDEYSCFLSDAYYELMVIHPFREGNGRSVREFLREFVLCKNNLLPFEVQFDFSRIDSNEFIMAIRDKYIYPSMLQMLFKQALIPVEKNYKKL